MDNREDTNSIRICKKWYDEYKENERNPRTNRKISPDKRVWKSLEKECQPFIRDINENILKVVNTPEPLHYPEIDNLLQDIHDIVDENWDNPNLDKRCTYHSESNDGIPDLFTAGDIKDSLVNQNSSILAIENKEAKGSKKLTDAELIKDFDYELGDFGSTDAKKPLMDVATEFNTIHFIGSMETRLHFIGLITKCFTQFCRLVHGKMPKLNEHSYNIMFKGGTTVRFLIKELVRDFTRDIENHILDKIRDSIKLSDYDFEMMCNPELINEEDMVKLNILSYIVVLRLKKYLEKHKTYYFNFFQLQDSVKSEKLEKMRDVMNKKVKKFTPTITTIRGKTINNFYKDITIDYIEFANDDCETGRDPVLNTHTGTPDLTKYKTNQWYQALDSEDRAKGDELFNNNCRTDFALIMDGSEHTDFKGHVHDKAVPEVAIAFISAKNLFKKYGISKKSCSYYTTSKTEGSQFYATHNPLINNPKIDMKFQLNRIKYSYTIYFTKTINGKKHYFRDFIPGEILDLSCAYGSDRKSDKFIQPFNQNKYIQTYQFANYDLSFYSYSIWGHVKDMESMIFTEPDHQPWNLNPSDKYKKRITRLLYLGVLYLFTDQNSKDRHNRTISYNKKVKYLRKLEEMMDEDFSRRRLFRIDILELLRSNLKECSYYRDKEVEKYQAFKQYVLSELDELISIMQTEYNLTRNQELNMGPIESGVLTVNQPSIYNIN